MAYTLALDRQILSVIANAKRNISIEFGPIHPHYSQPNQLVESKTKNRAYFFLDNSQKLLIILKKQTDS